MSASQSVHVSVSQSVSQSVSESVFRLVPGSASASVMVLGTAWELESSHMCGL